MRYAARQAGTSWGMGADTGEDWRAFAVCRDEDPELFFPVGEGSNAEFQTEQAKAVCRRCPVMVDCEKWTARVRPEYGVFAGLDPRQRKLLYGQPINRPRRTAGRCRNDHVQNEENSRRDQDGVLRCRVCERESVARSRRRKAVGHA